MSSDQLPAGLSVHQEALLNELIDDTTDGKLVYLVNQIKLMQAHLLAIDRAVRSLEQKYGVMPQIPRQFSDPQAPGVSETWRNADKQQ